MSNSNSNPSPWDIHTSLNRNPSTATGASVFSSDYFHPSRYDSRRSIGSTVGPPPLSPRPAGGQPGAGTSSSASVSPVSGPSSSSASNNLFHQHLRNSTGSPWPIPSAPSSPAPLPPPVVQSQSGFGSRSRSRGIGIGMHTAGPSISSSSFSSSSASHSQNQSQSQTQAQSQNQLSPLAIPEIASRPGTGTGTGRISPSSAGGSYTPIIQRPASHVSQNSRVHSHSTSRASMEHEFSVKHAQLVDQAVLLLAEMRTLQILGPIHGPIGPVGHSSSDDNTSSQYQYQGDNDTSSLLSGSNTNTNTNTTTTNPNNNTAIYYEQDEASMAALSAILQGKLGSLVSKPPPKPARAVAREVVARFGTISPSSNGTSIEGPEDEEAEGEAIELLMGDYEAVLGWARSSASTSTNTSQRPISSAASASSSQGQGQGQNQNQVKIQRCLDERQVLLEAALPAWLGHLPSEALMHFGHEKLYVSPLTTTARSRGTSIHSGRIGNGNGNGNGHATTTNGSLTVNGNTTSRERERGASIPQQTYTNTQTFEKNLPIEDIPRRRFLKTQDGYAWDMLELASALENDPSFSSSTNTARRGGGIPVLRNPVTRAFFSPEDVSRILGHPMGRGLGPYPASRRRSVSPVVDVRPVSPALLPDPVAAFVTNQNQNQDQEEEQNGDSIGSEEFRFGAGSRGSGSGSGNYRPRLYGHDDEGIEPGDDSRRPLLGREQTDHHDENDIPWTVPPPPYGSASETETQDGPVVPQSRSRSPASPPPAVPVPVPIINTTNNRDSSSYPVEPLRPYSPPISPPPLLTTTHSEPPERPVRSPPVPVTRPPLPRPLPGSYPTWEEREQDNDERFNPDFVSSSRYELLAAPLPVPVPVRTASPSSPNLGVSGNENRGSTSPIQLGRSTSPKTNTIPSPSTSTSTNTNTAGLIQELANGLASIPIPIPTTATPTPTMTNTSRPPLSGINSGGEYRSSLLGNLEPDPSISSVPSSPPSPAFPAPLVPRRLSTSTSSRQSWFMPITASTSAPEPVAESNQQNTSTASAIEEDSRTTWESKERTSTQKQEQEQEKQQNQERGRWETNWAENNYLSSSYGVATPPPSGPIPVSSLALTAAAGAASTIVGMTTNLSPSTSPNPNYDPHPTSTPNLNPSTNAGASNTSGAGGNSSSNNTGYRISGYFFSLGASHRNISLEQSHQQSQSQQQGITATVTAEEEEGQGQGQDIQRGRWETREHTSASASANTNHHNYSNSNPNPNPFASSRDPSANGGGRVHDEEWRIGRGPPTGPISQIGRVAQVAQLAEMDADALSQGPFELADTPPRLPELGGGTISRRPRGAKNNNHGGGGGGGGDGGDDDNDDARSTSKEWMGELSSA